MQLNVITYSRNKNLGNYESEKLEMTFTVEEHECQNEALRNAKIMVAQGLGLQPKVEQIDEVVEGGDVKTKDGKVKDPATGEEAKKKTKKKVAKKKPAAKKAAKPETETIVKDDILEEGTSEPVSLSEVKEALVKVWKLKGRNVADDILKEFGVAKSGELTEDQFSSVIAECEKCLK